MRINSLNTSMASSCTPLIICPVSLQANNAVLVFKSIFNYITQVLQVIKFNFMH